MAVQTIGYGDKQFLNQNSDIADVNKVNDTDMNEIKSVVNNNAQEVANITGQILWTNSNPTSDFNGQNIQLQTTDFDMVQIIYYAANNVTRYQSTGFIPVGESVLSTMMNAKSYIRPFRIIDNILTFDDCRTYNSYNSLDMTINNAALIPIYIIGYKTGLFN